MNKRHYEHTLPNIRGSLSNTYTQSVSFSATLPFIRPFIRSGIRSYIQPGIHPIIRLSACPAVQPFDRLAV